MAHVLEPISKLDFVNVDVLHVTASVITDNAVLQLIVNGDKREDLIQSIVIGDSDGLFKVNLNSTQTGQLQIFKSTHKRVTQPTANERRLSSLANTPGGVVTLDGTGKIPSSIIPASALPEVFIVANETARLSLSVDTGDEAIQLDNGSQWIFSGSWYARPNGTGDFSGPSSSINNELVTFSGGTGKIGKGGSGVSAASGNLTLPGFINGINLTNLNSQTQTHISASGNVHGVSIANINPGTLAQLNNRVTDATLDTATASRPPNGLAGGDLGNSYPNPKVLAFTSGSQQITFGNIIPGQVLVRNGNSISSQVIPTVAPSVSAFSAYCNNSAAISGDSTWVDIPLANVHLKTSQFSHNTNTAPVTITETGIYEFNGYMTIDQVGGNNRSDFYLRLVQNTGSGFVEVGGTRGIVYSRQNIQGGGTCSFSIAINATLGTIYKIQISQKSGNGTAEVLSGTGLNIMKLSGVKGDPGAPGSGGTITTQQNLTTINASTDTLRFGTGLSLTNVGSGIVSVANTPQVYQASSTTTVTTTSATPVLLNAMTLTPGSGAYLVNFSTSIFGDSINSTTFVSLFVGGTQVPHTERRFTQSSPGLFGATTTEVPISFSAHITGLGPSTVVEVRWRNTAGTSTSYQRTLVLQKVG